MLKKTVLYIIIFLFSLNLFSCRKKVVPLKKEKPVSKKIDKQIKYDEEHITRIISEDTVWEGVVTVDGIFKIAKGATLTILPGTTVEFTYHDYDKDGLGDSGLVVEGSIVAQGTYGEHILFTAVGGDKHSGAWGMILVNFSNDVIFDYCKFEYSNYTLHIHFSTGSITNSLFTNNEDGTRIGRSKFIIQNNVFKDNKVKGVNFTDSKNYIKYNEITGNKHGIFLFEGDKGSDISHNNIYDNRIYNFKLGDFFIGDVSLHDNFWRALSAGEAGEKIFDKKYDDTLGVVSIKPVVSRYEDTGIIKEINVTKVFEYETDGYIDSTAAIDRESGTIYFGSFDGHLYAIDAYTGALRFKFDTGDIIDSSPAIDSENVYFASWNRNVYCLDKTTGDLKWTYEMKSSEQDDHRQSSPVIVDGLLYIGGLDGTVYALDVRDGEARWKFSTTGSIRSKGVVDGTTIIFGSADGKLYGLSMIDGRGKWFVDLGAPILSTPLLLDDVLIVATKKGPLYMVDLETREVKSGFPNKSVNFYSAPIAYKEDIVFATTDNKLYRLKKKGLKQISVTDIKGPAYATPFVYEDFIISPNNSGDLNIIERGAAKRVIQTFKAGNAIQSTPVLFDGKLYFGTRDNKFYAVKIETSTVEGF